MLLIRTHIVLLTILGNISIVGAQPTHGIDSLKQIRWNIVPLKCWRDIHGNDSTFCDYEREEYTTAKSDVIVMAICGQKTGFSCSGIVPKKYTYKIKTPKDTRYIEPKSKQVIPPDSILEIDRQALDRFYLEKKDSLKIDTLFVERVEIQLYGNDLSLKSKCIFRSDKKDGEEINYYTLQELKGVCIVDNLGLKSKGFWRDGKKHGKWIEYNKTGSIDSIKKYKNGELVKEKIY